ncbi:MAG: T9SS type A sorting domain-containing protein [Bacteroidota bacterium]
MKKTLFVIVLLAVPAVAHAQRTVTARLNTATLPDTTQVTALVEIRGALDGVGGTTLPDGNVLDWDATSTIEPTNQGGDYWDVTFNIPDNAELQFKFYAQQAESAGIGGWEDGANHRIAAGTGDVDLGVHYFEKGETDRVYDWRPFESKPDTVAVWFRVYMSTADALDKGYDRAQEMTIGVRGDPLGPDGGGQGTRGPLDWGSTQLILSREGVDSALPGIDLYSGVAYYPQTAVGTLQNYKFVIERPSGAIGWEADVGAATGNRQFTIPAADTTLHWVYFSDDAPVDPGVRTADVTFSVDLSPLKTLGLFSEAAGDRVQVRGSFNGWDGSDPANSQLSQQPGTDVYASTIPITAGTDQAMPYTFYVAYDEATIGDRFGVSPPSGWEVPILRTGGLRQFALGAAGDVQLDVAMFNDIRTEYLVLDDRTVEVTFSVDMAPARAFAGSPFQPGTDSVYVDLRIDAFWAATQPRVDGIRRQSLYLEDPDADLVYTRTLHLEAPTYSALQYRYGYGLQASRYIEEQGGSPNSSARHRVRYIPPDGIGSWPTQYALPADVFVPTGDLPTEGIPPAVVRRSLQAGWNVVGLPIAVTDSSHTVLFPGASPNGFFGFNGGYVVPAQASLARGQGYWLQTAAGSEARLSGSAIRLTRTMLQEGWNLVSGPLCTVPAGAIQDPSGAVLEGTLFGFNGTYAAASAFAPLEGYWLRAREAGMITLDCDAAGKTEAPSPSLASLGEIMLEDATGQQQRLYFGAALGDLPAGAYTTPPPGPSRRFQAMFDEGRYVTQHASAIDLVDAQYPVYMHMVRLPAGHDPYRIAIGEASYEAQPGLALRFDEGAAPRLLASGAQVPEAFALAPNYPNPFNPTTTFRFALPEASLTSLAVYDLMGRRVATIVENTRLTAGWHSVPFDARALASGVYVYRLKAGAFTAGRTLTVLK